jgi:threonine synthase
MGRDFLRPAAVSCRPRGAWRLRRSHRPRWRGVGRVTSGAVIAADGSVQEFTNAAAAQASAGAGQVELRYAYGPALLPPPDRPPGLWRYTDLLPIEEGSVAYPLAVGATPLLAPQALRSAVGLPGLWLKDETRGPSGSNKDRATALVCEAALRQGAATVTCASTGNVAASLAIGAAASGLRAVVFVPAAVAPGKLQLMLAAGALVVGVRQGYEAAFRLSREAAAAFGWVDRNTGVNPATVEAKKTVAFEIWEQLGRRMPEAVIAPVGDGPTLYALGKGFRELVACGVPGPLPRIIGVQADGCQPVKRAWEAGVPVRPVAGQTLADGIAVDAPVSGGAVLHEVRASGGGLVAVTDAEMLDAISLLARRAGVLAEPAGAAATAGLVAARASGLLAPDDTVVALVTGTGLKTPEHLRPRGRAIEIEGRLAEVEAVL